MQKLENPTISLQNENEPLEYCIYCSRQKGKEVRHAFGVCLNRIPKRFWS